MRTERILQADRYLPCRKANSTEHSWRQDSHSHTSTAASSHYLDLITSSSARCLTFTKTTSQAANSCLTFGKPRQYLTDINIQARKKQSKKVLKIQAEKIVEVPGFQNNFYYSSFDLSSDDLLGIGLKKDIYIYNVCNQATFMLNEGASGHWRDESLVTSLRFSQKNPLLYAGRQDGSIDLLDLNKLKTFRIIDCHLSRIGCIENTEEWGFLSGSKDKMIVHHDIRVKNSCILKVLAHKTEVCGLTFRNNTVASGSIDGRVNIWDLRNKNAFVSKKFHQSAAKALEWCPWKLNLLASGSGSKDPQIVLWNHHDQTIQNILNPKSQVTGLKWLQHSKDIVTIHGSGKGQGFIWNPETGRYHTILSGHEGKILGLGVEKNKGIWTIGADQTMRFWRTGALDKEEKEKRKSSMMDLKLK